MLLLRSNNTHCFRLDSASKVLPKCYQGDMVGTRSMLLLTPLASAQTAVVWNKVALAFFYSLSFQFYKQQTLSIQFGTTVQLKICIVHLVYREALRFPSWLYANITLLLKRLYINIALYHLCVSKMMIFLLATFHYCEGLEKKLSAGLGLKFRDLQKLIEPVKTSMHTAFENQRHSCTRSEG